MDVTLFAGKTQPAHTLEALQRLRRIRCIQNDFDVTNNNVSCHHITVYQESMDRESIEKKALYGGKGLC